MDYGPGRKWPPHTCAQRQPTVEGVKIYPGMQGGTNWYSPSWSPHTGIFYISAWKDYFSIFSKLPDDYVPGRVTTGALLDLLYRLSTAVRSILGRMLVVMAPSSRSIHALANKNGRSTCTTSPQRDPDHGLECSIYWKPGRILLGSRCRDGHAFVACCNWRPDLIGPGHLSGGW